MTSIKKVALIFSLFFGVVGLAQTTLAVELPAKPSFYVNDYAQKLDARVRSQLDQHFKALDDKYHHQVVVAIFADLGGEEIDDFSNRLFEKWRIGDRERNDGVLLVIALKERKLRIEVGYGLESLITDAYASDIIRSHMAPILRDGKLASAVLVFAHRIEARFDPNTVTTTGSDRSTMSPLLWIIILGLAPFITLVLWLIIFSPRSVGTYSSRRRRNSWFDDWGGGGGGWGGSGGGGGFGGGGGLSGGGGSSGGW